MSRMDSIPEHLQGQVQLIYACDSDMSDSSHQSYQTTDGFPGTRQSSLNTEPLTLDAEEIGNAKDEAEHVLETVGPEDADDIFTKNLQVKNGKAVKEEEMAKELAKQPASDHQIRDSAEKMGHQIEDVVQKAAEILEANEKLSQASKSFRCSKERASEGQHLVQ